MTFSIRQYNEFRDGKSGSEMQDFTLNEGSFSIPILGNGYEDFAKTLSENAIWISSNFYNSTSPDNPIVGQTWFDSVNNVVMVYNTDNIWQPLTTGILNTEAVDTPVYPDFGISSDVGTDLLRYNNLYTGGLYTETFNYENAYGSVKDIVIDFNSNSSLVYSDNLYEESGAIPANTTLMKDLDDLVDGTNVNQDTPWTTTVINDSLLNRTTYEEADLVKNTTLIYNLTDVNTDVNITKVTFDFRERTIEGDTQLMVILQDAALYGMSIVLPPLYNYNYINGNVNRFNNLIYNGPLLMTILKTDELYTFDVLVSRGYEI